MLGAGSSSGGGADEGVMVDAVAGVSEPVESVDWSAEFAPEPSVPSWSCCNSLSESVVSSGLTVGTTAAKAVPSLKKI